MRTNAARSCYRYALHVDVDGTEILTVIDEMEPDAARMSVTNNIEAVLENIAGRIGRLPPTIYYCDTDKIWTGVATKPDGTFLRFGETKK